MLDIKTLLPELKKLVTALSEDLLTRCLENEEINAGLREAYTQIEKGGRTAQAFEVWREDYLDQVAVAWVLGCVFVRFMEDNHLIDECWLAGEGERRKLAEDTHELYFRDHPHESDREYFEHVFHEVGKIRACRDLFAEGKTPLWAVGPSGDAAMKLLGFLREIDAEGGQLKRSFEAEDGDTRFLGDLYEDLSERARKKYALLQTPVFIEEFILNRTLDPAINKFGLDKVRMIDPTCGSGHFLLGGFGRLFDLWVKREDNEIVAAQKALDGVWGVDINPFAVAIARFRLIVAALSACGIMRLKEAPGWNIHLATGDSLLFGNRWFRAGERKAEQKFLESEEVSWTPEIYACEDKEAIRQVLGQQYHVVVGNPPYITVKDRCLNQAYRARYGSCHRGYSLAVPFMERFFELCITGEDGNAGYVGKITANSFMRREFGKKLIESYLPRWDLTHIIDTQCVHLPRHGIATVILLGRHCAPTNDTIRVVSTLKNEEPKPQDPAQGKVWLAVLSQVDLPNSESEFATVADMDRQNFKVHPWSIGGAGAAELKGTLDSVAESVDGGTLGGFVKSIGFYQDTHADEAFVYPNDFSARHGVADAFMPQSRGDDVRDWHATTDEQILFPYDRETIVQWACIPNEPRFAWFHALRTFLWGRSTFGGGTYKTDGRVWFDYHQFPKHRSQSKYLIAFAAVATHNHFALGRRGTVFNRSAPVVILPEEASKDDHFALLGVLNCASSSFWMKQVFQDKGGGGIGGGISAEAWERRFDHDGTKLKKLPIPWSPQLTMESGVCKAFAEFASRLDRYAKERACLLPAAICSAQTPPTLDALTSARLRAGEVLKEMITLQEELDWFAYRAFGQLGDAAAEHSEAPSINLGERAFEIVVARKMARGEAKTEWFHRHKSNPVTELPESWSHEYRHVIEHRVALIKDDQNIGLIESPNYKRRWNVESWEGLQEKAIRSWLLQRLETRAIWPDPEEQSPTLQSTAQLADRASRDHDLLCVSAIYRGREDFDMGTLVAELVESESVPLLRNLIYSAAGLRKRTVWEKSCEVQRMEDSGEKVGKIKVPPKYSSIDFQKSDCWRLRGKLDIPKERWISFPYCETDSDPSLVVGRAGWNHLQQATALVAYYDARKREGWSAERLTPLLAGLDQLIPWIHRWHPEVDPEFGETAGQSFQTMLEHDVHELGLTLEDIRGWTPPAKKKARRKKVKV